MSFVLEDRDTPTISDSRIKRDEPLVLGVGPCRRRSQEYIGSSEVYEETKFGNP